MGVILVGLVVGVPGVTVDDGGVVGLLAAVALPPKSASCGVGGSRVALPFAPTWTVPAGVGVFSTVAVSVKPSWGAGVGAVAEGMRLAVPLPTPGVGV